MIQITKNSTNTVVLSLSEKTTLVAAKYLFEFIKDQDNTTIYFIAADISVNPKMYNEFAIGENVVQIPLIGIVSLSLGFWKYKVREQLSTTNLNPLLSGAIVENGKVKVSEVRDVAPVFENVTTVTPVFNG